MFIELTELTEDDDEVLHHKKVMINPLNIVRFYALEDEPTQTFIETTLVDEGSMIVVESYQEVMSRIRMALS